MEKMYKNTFHFAKVQMNTDLFPQDGYLRPKKRKKKREGENYTGAKLILNTSFRGKSLQTNHSSSWIEQKPVIKETPKQPTRQTILSVSYQLIDLSDPTAFNRSGKYFVSGCLTLPRK